MFSYQNSTKTIKIRTAGMAGTPQRKERWSVLRWNARIPGSAPTLPPGAARRDSVLSGTRRVSGRRPFRFAFRLAGPKARNVERLMAASQRAGHPHGEPVTAQIRPLCAWGWQKGLSIRKAVCPAKKAVCRNPLDRRKKSPYTMDIGIQTEEAAPVKIELRLYELEELLPSHQFVRVSHSEIINLRRVTALDLGLTGTIRITLDGGVVTYASRRYVKKIKEALGL